MSWAQRAGRAITAAMASVPKDATEKDVQAALSAGYPFGERSNHPYKIWLKCVEEYLAGRFPKGEVAKRRFLREERRKVARGLSPLPDGVIDKMFQEAEEGGEG